MFLYHFQRLFFPLFFKPQNGVINNSNGGGGGEMSIVVQYFNRRYPTFKWTISIYGNFMYMQKTLKIEKKLKF